MNFTAITPQEVSANERPVDMFVNPQVFVGEDGKPYMRIDVPLADAASHIGISRNKDTGKVQSAGFAVKTNPAFAIAANGLKVRCDTIAKQAGDKYTSEDLIAATLSVGQKGIWISAKLSADVTPRK